MIKRFDNGQLGEVRAILTTDYTDFYGLHRMDLLETEFTMSDFNTIYTNFNWVEGCLWLVVAILLPFLFKHPTRAKKFAIVTASLGFVAFGVSDFIEASLPGDIPWWLWALKIACGVVILGSRFAYVGWDRFRFTDRYFLFGLFCLIAVAVIVVIQW